jgi:hypothetical protein
VTKVSNPYQANFSVVWKPTGEMAEEPLPENSRPWSVCSRRPLVTTTTDSILQKIARLYSHIDGIRH